MKRGGSAVGLTLGIVTTMLLMGYSLIWTLMALRHFWALRAYSEAHMAVVAALLVGNPALALTGTILVSRNPRAAAMCFGLCTLGSLLFCTILSARENKGAIPFVFFLVLNTPGLIGAAVALVSQRVPPKPAFGGGAEPYSD